MHAETVRSRGVACGLGTNSWVHREVRTAHVCCGEAQPIDRSRRTQVHKSNVPVDVNTGGMRVHTCVALICAVDENTIVVQVVWPVLSGHWWVVHCRPLPTDDDADQQRNAMRLNSLFCRQPRHLITPGRENRKHLVVQRLHEIRARVSLGFGWPWW
jgi:hypothetical protein